MGNTSSRGASGGHDSDGYFFEQTTFRKTPKRYKKTPDELPDELKFAHLNPKVAAFLANKEKEKTENALDFDDGLGNKSLLPEINRTVSLLRNRLDSLLSTEDDQQRQQFLEKRIAAPGLLVYLAKYLYLWEGLHISMPRSLEGNLSSNFHQLIGEVYVIPREWQILSNKEEYLARTVNSEMTSQKGEDLTRPETVMSISKMTDDGDIATASKELSSHETPKFSRSKSKLALSRASTLGEINEENNRKDGPSRPISRQLVSDSMSRIPASKKESREKGETLKPKTRLERFKSNLQVDTKPSGGESRRGMRKDTDSVLGEPISHENPKQLGGGKDPGSFAVNFQLSNAVYEEMGWIVHPTSKEDPERETILKWATQHLQLAMKKKKMQDQELRERGHDKPACFRYYGDSRKEMVEKYKSSHRTGSASSTKNNPIYKGEKPIIPDSREKIEKDKRPFLVTTSDGASTVFYPSGRPAIVMCRMCLTNPEADKLKSKPMFYTLVYDNTPDRAMLAAFTPSGKNCIYHNNGKVKFLSDRNGGTLAAEDGSISRRWKWPSHHRLPVPVSFQINNFLTFRCLNLHQMQLYFSCEKETCKINVGAVQGCEEPSREEIGYLISGTSLSSATSKEFAKPYKNRSQQSEKGKKRPLKSKLEILGDTGNLSRKSSANSQLTFEWKDTVEKAKFNSRSRKSTPKFEKPNDKRNVTFTLIASDTPKDVRYNDDNCLNRIRQSDEKSMRKRSFSENLKTEKDEAKSNSTTPKNKSKDLDVSNKSSSPDKRSRSLPPVQRFKAIPAIQVNNDSQCFEETSFEFPNLRSQRMRSISSTSDISDVSSKLTSAKLPGRSLSTAKLPSLGSVFQNNLLKSVESAQLEKEKQEKEKKSKADMLINLPEEVENDEDADKQLHKLQRKAKNIVEDWLEHYRIAVGISSPFLHNVKEGPIKAKRVRDIKSAKPGGGVVIIEREATSIPRPKISVRARSAYIARDERPNTASTTCDGADVGTMADVAAQPTGSKAQVKFEDTLVSGYMDTDTYSMSRTTTFGGSSLPGSAGSCRIRSAPFGHHRNSAGGGAHQGAGNNLDPTINPAVALCPIALRLALLGHQRVVCRCSRHKLPNICDIELDEFVQKQAPEKQLIVIAVKSILAPAATPAENMLESLHDEKNRNRTKPCMQSRNDSYRLFWYDVVSASDFSDHTQPLLVRRHNVVPGMFLVYESGNLVFCDHIFNGYGNARKDFQKQLSMCRKIAIMGQVLPKDFKFSPVKGRHGMRSGWGGEIGGVIMGGTSKNNESKRGDQKRGSVTSLSSGDSSDLPLDYTLSGVNCSTSQPTESSALFHKKETYRIRPLSQPNFDGDVTRIKTLLRPKSQTVSSSLSRVTLPEIESSA